MPMPRQVLVGPPHTYFVQVATAQGGAVFASPEETAHLLVLLERLRAAFDLRIYGYLISSAGLRLILRHHPTISDADDQLRLRWAAISGSPLTTIPRIKQRFASLGGFMQTLLQRFSRDWNRRHLSRGHLWAGRYRACLLADDTALLTAVAWLEDDGAGRATAVSRSTTTQPTDPAPVQLAPLPLRRGPDGSLFPRDESPPGLPPMPQVDIAENLIRFVAGLSREDLVAYGMALLNGWAFGRPESLSEALSRLGRVGGRGRSRQQRELDDQLGLCGVWG
jgi:hypothetical protein